MDRSRLPVARLPLLSSKRQSAVTCAFGADLVIESIQVAGDTVWLGDEFGPFVISATLNGRITGVYPAMAGAMVLKGPDSPGISATSVMGKDWTVQRSGGYEGLALQPGTGLF